MEGLFGNPAFMAGMGLLSSNAQSLTPQNPMQSVMQNLQLGAQMKNQQQRTQAFQQQADAQAQRAQVQQQALQQKQQQAQLQRQRIQQIASTMPPGQREAFLAAPNEYLKQMASNQYAKPDLPSSVQEYQFAQKNGYTGDYNTFMKEVKKSGTTVNVGDTAPYKLPTGYMLADAQDPSKGVIPIPGGDKDLESPNRQFTQDQQSAAGYADRMSQSEKRINDLFTKTPDFNPANRKDNYASALPFGNEMTSEDFKLYKQASDDWIRAKLRKESGAVIGEDEMQAEYESYFPVPGDTPDVIAQKREARQTAMNSMANQSQGAFKGSTENFAKPMTDDDFNSLPVGSLYRDPDDGKLYRKTK